jgi:hypothetical protein
MYAFTGQNKPMWEGNASRNQRYDYEYSEAEIRGWVPRIVQVSQGVKDTYVYYNHYQGNAAKNAKTLQGFFGLVRQGIWDSTAPDRDRLTDRGQGPVTRRRTGSLRLRILEIEVAREPILTRKRKEPIW